jgi:tRNA-dihydrouridine synthase B
MALTIRHLVVHPPLALAPMVGLSHSVLRTLVIHLGGVGLLFSEMLSAKRLPSENHLVSPGLVKSPLEYPLFYQIYASETSDIEAATTKLEVLGAQGIDLNLGCPAPQLKKIGAGKFLMERPDKLVPVLRRLRKSTELPVSVKIRIGEHPDRNRLLHTCRMLEGEGVDLITVHARLAGEKFCRRPRWEILDDLVPRLSVPVFVNGGIFSVDDARNCLGITGAAGLMIGRGVVRWPWLIKEIARELYQCESPLAEYSREGIYFTFIDLLNERFPIERRLGRLKQFTHYYASSQDFGHLLASRIQSSSTIEQATERARDFFRLEA